MASSSDSQRPRQKKRKISEDDDDKPIARVRKKRRIGHKDTGDESTSRKEFVTSISDQRKRVAKSPAEYAFEESRIIQSHDGPTHGVPVSSTKISGVVYWMQRDQRVQVES